MVKKRIIKAIPLNFVQSSFGVSSHSLKYSNTFRNTNIHLPNVNQQNEINNKKRVSIIYMHGLFGSSDNFRLTNKLLVEKFHINVDLFSLDIRNHGSSPHSKEISLKHIEKDLQYFIERIVLNNKKEKEPNSKIILVGHSLGGKSNMLYALNNPSLVDGLVCIDVSPSCYVGVHNHDSKFEAMIGASTLFDNPKTTKNDIDKKMQEFNLNKGERLYLMNNLIENDKKKFQWRVNVDTLRENQDKLLSFPKISTKKQFDKKVLFIGGGDSHYLKKPFRDSIHTFFPNHEINLIPQTSHFCFAEKTKPFNEILYLYLKNIINK
ncbi:hypothetical protein DICPUDRAFT_35109 [Dictyostelium purpureum]|uniref:AB hydrolase-1 domain-containing protein n=1 Tax=Dictyostelium purpureum TaxID=5786 RepID=F0ZNV5_DICPU|nr:uncharacterized protein DICPUDRAFT_35109 [Dictyostelium purpureum]EGC34359.1 hypothetical protein DICPUDRAFT_35109 [Dictyostelium purpureum]|eukprot:XP_003289093.1 hypothetical protein DICPUDRAFT_35109 [Dictyostelium purpureum]